MAEVGNCRLLDYIWQGGASERGDELSRPPLELADIGGDVPGNSSCVRILGGIEVAEHHALLAFWRDPSASLRVPVWEVQG